MRNEAWRLALRIRSIATNGKGMSMPAAWSPPLRPPRNQRLNRHGTGPSDLLSIALTTAAIALTLLAAFLRKGAVVMLLTMALYEAFCGEDLHLLERYKEGLTELAAKQEGCIVGWGALGESAGACQPESCWRFP